jgi:hypothetical protein
MDYGVALGTFIPVVIFTGKTLHNMGGTDLERGQGQIFRKMPLRYSTHIGAQQNST